MIYDDLPIKHGDFHSYAEPPEGIGYGVKNRHPEIEGFLPKVQGIMDLKFDPCPYQREFIFHLLFMFSLNAGNMYPPVN